MNEIKVSIITVCYNSEKTIERTIRSVLNQTYKNFEYYIIDGASTDGTVEIANKYRESFEGKMTIVSEPDKGIYDAMNKGIRLTDGELIGIINSDDYYENNAVELMAEAYKNNHDNPLSVYYGFDRAVIEGKEVSIGFKNAEFLDSGMISHPSCFVTREAYEQMGTFDTKYSCVADYDLMLRYKHSGKVTFVPVYEIIANFSLGGTCSTDKAERELWDLKATYGIMEKGRANWLKFLNKSSEIFRKLIGAH